MTNKISVVEKIGYGSGDMAANLLFHTWNLILLKFYTDVFGLTPTDAATMFLFTRLIDIVTDPTIGIIADRTNSRWGKYRPWVILGSIPLGLAGYLMFITPDMDYTGKLIFAWVSYSLAMLIYTIVQIPYSALMGVMTSDAQERTDLSTFRFFFAFGGQMIITGPTFWLVEYFSGGSGEMADQARGYQNTLGLFMVLATALYFFTFFSTKERVTVEPSKEKKSDVAGDLGVLVTNFGWLVLFASAFFNLLHVAVRNGSLLYYFDYYVGDVSKFPTFGLIGGSFFLAGIVGANILARYVNKRIILIVCTCSVGVLLGLFYLIPPDNYPMMIALHCLISVISGPIPVLIYVLYAELADYIEWKSGRKVMALVYSTMTTGVKVGLTLGVSIAGYLLGLAGYVANQDQTPQALEAIVLLATIVPGICAVLSGLCIVLYPVTDKDMKVVEKELAARRKQGITSNDAQPDSQPASI